MNILDTFPRRPMPITGARPRPFRTGILPFIFGAGMAVMLVNDILDLRDEFRLRESGVAAQRTHVKEVRRRAYGGFLLPTYTVTGSYRSADGADHDMRWEYHTLIAGFPDTEFTVRYDPADLSRTSTSWGLALMPQRILIAALFFFPFSLLFLYFAFRPGLEYRRITRKLRNISADPVPVEAKHVRAERDDSNLRRGCYLEFRWTDPATGEIFIDRTLFSGQPRPFWLDRHQTTMLALARNGEACLLDADLKTVGLSADERVCIFEARRRALNPDTIEGGTDIRYEVELTAVEQPGASG